MKLSLMTVNMLFPIAMKIMKGCDPKDVWKDYTEMMAAVGQSGFDSVDISSLEVNFFGLDVVRRELNRYHLTVASLIHFYDFAAVTEAAEAEVIKGGKAAVDEAVELGSGVVMMVPQVKDTLLSASREEMAESLVRQITPVVQYAVTRKIRIVIEDTPDLRIPLCTTKELKFILERIPDLYMVYDSGNMILVKEDPVHYFDTFSSRIGHVHLKDMMLTDASNPFADTAKDGRKMTAAPSGRGCIDFPTLLKHIKSSGYDGYLAVEYAKAEGKDHVSSMIEAREYFEKLL